MASYSIICQRNCLKPSKIKIYPCKSVSKFQLLQLVSWVNSNKSLDKRMKTNVWLNLNKFKVFSKQKLKKILRKKKCCHWRKKWLLKSTFLSHLITNKFSRLTKFLKRVLSEIFLGAYWSSQKWKPRQMKMWQFHKKMDWMRLRIEFCKDGLMAVRREFSKNWKLKTVWKMSYLWRLKGS